MRHVDGTAAEFSAVEDAVAKSGGVAAGAVIDTWEDIWLAAGLLKTRLDDSRDAAASWLRAIPPDEVERVVELEDELGALATSLDARWRSLTQGATDAGRRLATLLPDDDQPHVPRRAAAADPAASAPIPVAAVAVPVSVPIRPPDRVTILIPAEVRAPSPAARTAGITPRPTSVPAVSESPSPAASVTLAASSSGPTVRPRSMPARPPPDSSGPAVRVAPTWPLARPEPAITRHGRRRIGLTAMALIVVVALAVIGSLLAAIIGPLGRDQGVGDSESEVPAAVDSDTGANPSMGSVAAQASPTHSPSGTSIPSSNVLTVDLHPIGLLDPEELPIARVIGSPEVAAFPTPFDRSLRLRGEAAGLCIGFAPSSREGPSSIAFDIHLGEAGAGGRLVVALPAPDGGQITGLALDLATLDRLDREAWYRLTVTAMGTAGRLEVTGVENAGLVLEADLAGDATVDPTRADEACLSASLSALEAFVFVDNLSVEP